MIYKAGIEQVEPGKWMTWVFDLPGCFWKAPSRTEVIEGTPQAIADYLIWLEGYEKTDPSVESDIQIEITEEFQNFYSEDNYWVNSFFDHDKVPLATPEVDHNIWLLHCTRSNLENVLRKITPDLIDTPIEGERFDSLKGILHHIAGAEHWYLDKFDLACERDLLPSDVFEKLNFVRQHTLTQLPYLTNNPDIKEVKGELWSARKIIRRALWHERVHTWHLENRLADFRNREKL